MREKQAKHKQEELNNLQSVSIVAAFPIGIVMVLIVISFLKDAKKYYANIFGDFRNGGLK